MRVVQSLIISETIDPCFQTNTNYSNDGTNDSQPDRLNVNQEIAITQPRVENNVIKDVPIALSNEQQLVQAQLISANNELYLDESILVLIDTQEYSIHEEVAGPSFGGSIQNATPTEGAEYMDTEVTELFNTAVSVQEADYMDTEVTEILDNSTKSVEEVTIYEVVTEYRPRPDVGQLLQQYPHIFIQLCDGEIIDAESGERIINIDLTQFIANTELEERPMMDTDPILTDQMSPGSLHIDSDYIDSTQQHPGSYGQRADISTELSASQLTNLERIIPFTSQLSYTSDQISLPLLAHQEVVGTTAQNVEEVESEVMQEVRDLISNIRPEGRLKIETQMASHTEESKWGGDGVPENDMVGIKQCAANKTPTNADCIKYLFGYEEIDDPKVPDAIHYQR